MRLFDYVHEWRERYLPVIKEITQKDIEREKSKEVSVTLAELRALVNDVGNTVYGETLFKREKIDEKPGIMNQVRSLIMSVNQIQWDIADLKKEIEELKRK